jgi:Tol biopolymer transport system component
LSSIEESGGYLFGAVWSPDGEWIAYSRTAPGTFRADVFISRTDGSDLWQVTNTPANEITVEWGSGSG